MTSTYAALQMAAMAVAARACMQLGRGRWSALVPSHVFGVSTTTIDPNGTKRSPRRLDERLT